MEIAACSMSQHADLQFDLYFGRTTGSRLLSDCRVSATFADLETLLVACSSFDCGDWQHQYTDDRR